MFKMTNEQYDIAKWIVQVVAPALVTLITGLGALGGYDVKVITGVIALLTTFAGTVLGISNINYNKDIANGK